MPRLWCWCYHSQVPRLSVNKMKKMKRELVFQEQDKLLKHCQIERTVSVFGDVLIVDLINK